MIAVNRPVIREIGFVGLNGWPAVASAASRGREVRRNRIHSGR
jgi:hypothetical protein